jgi:ATP-dependent Clp protease ATP-binding subunit ClpA
MFERFTTEARTAVRVAQEEARQLRHAYIGTEHLLLGLARGQGAAAQALQAHGITAAPLRQRILALTGDELDGEALAAVGIDLDRVKEATEAHLGPGALDAGRQREMKMGHLPMTKRGKKVLELAVREALHLKSGEIGSGHLLLGLIRDGEGLAISLLRESRIDLSTLRTEVSELMRDQAA